MTNLDLLDAIYGTVEDLNKTGLLSDETLDEFKVMCLKQVPKVEFKKEKEVKE